MEASVILDKARFSLADRPPEAIEGTTPAKTPRWSDDRLISLLNDAMDDLALTTDIFDSIGFIPLHRERLIYDLTVAIKINRIEYDSQPLEASSHDEMDARDKRWQATTGRIPTHFIYDLRKAGEFRLFPRLDETTSGLGEFTYGIITSFTVEEDAPIDLSEYSDETAGESLKVFYTRAPNVITAKTDPLDTVITRQMQAMLTSYVVGTALRDNQDSRNIELGLQELNQYQIMKRTHIIKHAEGGVNRQRKTSYNPVG